MTCRSNAKPPPIVRNNYKQRQSSLNKQLKLRVRTSIQRIRKSVRSVEFFLLLFLTKHSNRNEYEFAFAFGLSYSVNVVCVKKFRAVFVLFGFVPIFLANSYSLLFHIYSSFFFIGLYDCCSLTDLSSIYWVHAKWWPCARILEIDKLFSLYMHLRLTYKSWMHSCVIR